MGKINWYRRWPVDALEGMMELSLEERGAYNTVLDLIYVRDNNLPDDDRFVAGWMRVDVRVWKRIKQRLIDAGKLYVSAGLLRNGKADGEILSTLSRCLSAADAGRASGRSRAAKSDNKSNEIKEMNGTVVELPLERPLELTRTRTREEKERGDKSPPKKADAVELPPWLPADAWRGWLDMRRGKHVPNTPRAMMLAINKLDEFRRQGQDPAKLLDLATLNGWQSIYPARDGATKVKSAGHIGAA